MYSLYINSILPYLIFYFMFLFSPLYIVGVTEIDIADNPKKSTDIDPDGITVVETENSTSSTHAKVVRIVLFILI